MKTLPKGEGRPKKMKAKSFDTIIMKVDGQSDMNITSILIKEEIWEINYFIMIHV